MQLGTRPVVVKRTFGVSRAMLHVIALSLASAVAQPTTTTTTPPSTPNAAPPNAVPTGIKQGPSVEGITEYDLDNGLKVLLFPDPSKMTATVNVTYVVGSRNESYGETGMAHLLEHMLFKGSP